MNEASWLAWYQGCRLVLGPKLCTAGTLVGRSLFSHNCSQERLRAYVSPCTEHARPDTPNTATS